VTPEARGDSPLTTLADVAERLQRRLLPGEPPELDGLDIAFTYRSASTGVLSGGDFVDYYTRPPSNSLAFAIGDVAGKGVDAMATTFVTKFMLRGAVFGGQRYEVPAACTAKRASYRERTFCTYSARRAR